MSQKTYEIGQRRHTTRKLAILGIILLLLSATGAYGYQQFKKETAPVIQNSAGRTYEQKIPNAETQRFDLGTFGFDAPADWKLIKHDTAPYNLYSYRSTLTNADNRYLDVYVDSVPQKLAVNKAVAVRPQGNNLSHGMVSENCTTFTTAGTVPSGAAKPLAVPAKWDGVEFLCDNDNVMRNVVGTSSPSQINKVTLVGPTAGTHSFFFVYTDNNATPAYDIFYKMLESVAVK